MSYSATTFAAAEVPLLAVAAAAAVARVFPLGATGPVGAECCPVSSSITVVAAAAVAS